MVGVAAVSKDELNLPKPKITADLIVLTSLAVIGGFLFGYDCGVVTGALLYLKVYFKLTDWKEEFVVTATLIAAAIFSLVGGYLNEKFGRKPVIIASSVLFICGSTVLAVSYWFAMLLVGRVIVGIAIGMSSTTVPSYIAESSPPSIRGYMLTMFQLSITLGFWLAAVFDAAFSYIPGYNLNWRLMLGFAVVPALIQLIGFIFMPESPRWLATHGKPDQAYHILKKINGNDENAKIVAKAVLRDIEVTTAMMEIEKEKLGGGSTLLLMLKVPTVRKALVIGCLLQTFQQLCGINTVMYYSATIVNMAGVSSPTLDIWMAAVTSGVNFICTFIGIYLVERIGRRPLLLISVVGVFITSLLLGGGFILIASDAPYGNYSENSPLQMTDSCSNITSCNKCSYHTECGFCLYPNETSDTGACVSVHPDQKNLTSSNTQWAEYGRCAAFDFPNSPQLVDPNAQWDYGFCPTSYSWFPIMAMVLYLSCFSAGFGPMPWTINAEIYPNWARSTGNACSTFSNWFCNIFIGLFFLSLANAITRQGIYFLFAGVTFTGFVVFYLILPETKNKKIEEIELVLKGPWFSCGKPPASIHPFQDDEKIIIVQKEKI